MRRNILIAMGLGFVFSVSTIAGCTKQNTAAIEEVKEEPIGMTKAKSIALNEAGVNESEAIFTKEYFNEEITRPKYELLFHTEKEEFEYEIDASNGEILKGIRNSKEINEKESVPVQQSQQQTQEEKTMITQAEAINIACETVGFNQPDELLASYTEVDDGMEVWVIKMKINNTYYDIELDVYTGKVYSVDQSVTPDD